MESLYNYQNQLLASTQFLFRRDLLDEIDWGDRLIGLIGARGVGKTTCLLQHLTETEPEGQSGLYVSMDNLANPYPTIFTLAETFVQRGGRLLIIDEIHKYRGWAVELKNIYDLFPGLKVIISGSSILRIMDEGVDLSRRVVFYDLNGLSFREFINIKTGFELPSLPLPEMLENHILFAREVLGQVKPFAFFGDYLRFGYYPYFLQSENSYFLKLQATINYILEQEIPSLFNLDHKSSRKIGRALRLIAGTMPYQPNISKLAEAVELNRNTLLQYLSFLEKAGVLSNLYAAGSFYGKLTKPGKILLHHPNLLYALSLDQPDPGNVRECFIVHQLQAIFKVELAAKGDFVVNEKYIFEVGGKGKSRSQIAGLPNGYVIADQIEFGFENKIPLWLFGFLY
jgi:predicted AAA+ superfamily ATPase